jgi:biotin carboxylase
MDKTILFIGGGIEAVPGIRLAKEMGLHVVISDMDANAPGFAIANDYILASTYDINATVMGAKKYHNSVKPINGVICIASDVVLTVASVAKALSLPGVSQSTAKLSMDKLALKNKFLEHGIHIPWFSSVESIEQLRKIIDKRGYPLVLKPADSRGARGVLRITRGVDLDNAFLISKSHSPTGRVMVEEFLTGPQVSTESIVVNGKAHTLGFSDRNYEYLERYAPYIIENGGELPTFLSDDIQHAVREIVQKAVASMGVVNWVVKGDIVIHNNRPYIIELAARLSGGYFCTHEIPLSTGVNFVKQAICLSLGIKPNPSDLISSFQRGVGQRYLFPEPGRVVNISGVENIMQRPEVALCEIRVDVGDVIKPIENHPGRAGVVITTGSTRQEALDSVLKAVNCIKIDTVRQG